MPRFRLITTAASLGAVLSMSLAGTALAKGHQYAPPGNSGISQYVETVPGVGGGRPSNTVKTKPSASTSASTSGAAPSTSPPTPSLPTAVQHRLRSHGAAGKAAAALAAATAIPVVRRNIGTSSTTAGGPVEPSASSVSQLLATLGGSANGGGMGVLLPVILIASLIAISIVGLVRHRRSTG